MSKKGCEVEKTITLELNLFRSRVMRLSPVRSQEGIQAMVVESAGKLSQRA